ASRRPCRTRPAASLTSSPSSRGCDVGAWGALIQGVLSVDSGIQEGIAAKKQADRNTAAAYEAAADAEMRGRREAGLIRTQGAQHAAKQRVAYAGSGVDASVGTAANVV